MTGYIPSPPANGVSLGPIHLHFYGLLIAIGVLVAAWLAQKRWARLGGAPQLIVPIAFWAVIGGLVGARLYSVVTSWQQDTGGDPWQIFAVWHGGLGIWGGVGGGVLGGWLRVRRMKLPMAPLLDVVAPTLAVAQAIGRWGNYFNQELFGLPSKLPWAVRITNQQQLANIYPARYRTPHLPGSGLFAPGTFQPTFLYESIWDLATFGLLLLIERAVSDGRVRLRRGYLFGAYAALYTFGRFFTEYLRIDPAHRYLGLRLNDWTSIAVFLAATTVVVTRGIVRPAKAADGEELVGQPLPAAVLSAQSAALEAMAPAPLNVPATGPSEGPDGDTTAVVVGSPAAEAQGVSPPDRSEAAVTTSTDGVAQAGGDAGRTVP
ncbi:MAG TPA: prolipoprotein diacylglyceryl transferase [Acidimicrobiales bacterium]|nr:prolipoprotein diacylglyceryl transferase [Acidimicrobiales bacterium]